VTDSGTDQWSEQDGALAGVRVLDLSRFIAGPLCAQILGDMGAEVVKLERPGGEDARRLGPFVDGESLYVMTYNRNKLGVTLDTRSPRALPVLEALVQRSDVLVENYRPGTLEKMGLGYERLRELNPGLVVTSLSGFGQTGPMAGRALFDAIAQAMSGLMSRTGRPEDPPTMAGTFIADYLTGIYGALGTVTALYHRRATGTGQVVDVASLDALFSCLGTAPSAYLNLGQEPRRTGSRDPLSGPANLFQTADGWVYLHAGTNPLFARLCAAMGREELVEGSWSSIAGRMDDILAVEDVVGAWTGGMSTEKVSAVLTEAGIPFGPVLSVQEVVELPQLAAREMLVPTPHAAVGDVTLPGIPIKLSGSPGRVRRGAPSVGEHNDHVYVDVLGLNAQDVAALRRDGVI
jgi:crotonobetainyl-CoA:carnitine CoA-transferase CaiB-like acyl-CoA transferase